MTPTFDLLELEPIEKGRKPVIFLAVADRPAAHLLKVKARGPAGYVLTTSPLRTLARAIRIVATGGT